ncbi:MAG TPA: phosphatase PAP2 family protein [Gemmatimonadaceae bacterium]|nr:phosphatase PAP2 family protein [Gemmatimonadaceae bacterium]
MTEGATPASTPGSRLGLPLGRPRWTLVIVGYLLALASGWMYGAAIRAGGEWHDGAAWERALLLTVNDDLPRWLDTALYLVPWAGTNLTLGPLIGLFAAWLIWRGRRDLAVWVVVVELGVLSLNWLVKRLVSRDRPDIVEQVGWFGWGSYPSGHAMASLAVLMTLAALYHRATGRVWPAVTAFVLFLVIAYSRLLHGVHWPTDMIGGALVGLVWLIATWFAFVGLPDGDGRRAA